MSAIIPPDGVEQQSLKQFTEKAYLDYSMYVILDRALPHIGDGLKPVQRRIIYAMSELGLNAGAKHKKSARTIGDVLGKYHPHGDSACYEAMVLMAQPFSYRYTLVDGQGNWGSLDDPKSFAAMRYTEARLTAYAQTLLEELAQGTVDWVPNFDGEMNEPKLLPARLPNILLNGATGIAVGMATDIPPHNIRELVAATLHLLDHPKSTVDELCEFLPAPDFPTGAELITAADDLRNFYRNGTGSFRLRATVERENNELIVTALPYQVSCAKIQEQIGAQMHAKKLPMLEDLRDESDHENPVRLVLTPRSNRVDTDMLLSHLFATTDLERSYRVNLNIIGLDGRPQVKDLRTILTEWLTYRTQTVRRRLQFRLERVERRLHILDGLLIAFLNLDEVIRIVREEDHPKAALIARFELSDAQAEAILETKLRQLAKLEEMKIRAEQDKLTIEQTEINQLLNSERRMKTLLRNEIRGDLEKHGDDRRTLLVERAPAQALDENALQPSEPVLVVLSEQGWVRAAKSDVDPTALNYKAGDQFLASAQGRSNQPVVFLDSTGRSYSLAAHSMASARGYGEPLTGRLSPPPGSRFLSVLFGQNDSLFLLASTAGYGFVCRFEDLLSRNKAGRTTLSLAKGAQPLPAIAVTDVSNDRLVAVNSVGQLLVFPISELPHLSKGKGNKILGIPGPKFAAGEEYMLAVECVPQDAGLTLYCGKRHITLKAKTLDEYQGERGRRGKKLPQGFQKVDRISVER